MSHRTEDLPTVTAAMIRTALDSALGAYVYSQGQWPAVVVFVILLAVAEIGWYCWKNRRER